MWIFFSNSNSKKMKNFQKNVNLKKMMKMFKKIKKSEKPSKNQRKIFLQKNFRIFYFSQNYCRILFLPKTFINGPKKWKFWNNWFFSARGPRKLWRLHFQSDFHRILVTIKLNLMFHIFHGEKPKSNLMLPYLCNVPWWHIYQ